LTVDPILVALQVADALDACGVRYLVGGSLASSMKVDLFIMGGTKLDEEQMARRLRVQVSSSPDRFLHVYAPEDILLQKLRWYRLGGETSDRQWRDVLGIVRVQAGRLDAAYLRRGAAVLEVEDLLAKAMSA
jgi:hypothetical protein